MPDTALRRALRQATNNWEHSAPALAEVSDYSVSDPDDARAIATAIQSLDPAHLPGKTALQSLVALVQQVTTKEAFEILSATALPALLHIFDHGRLDDDLKLFFLKIFALYLDPHGARRIIESARTPLQPTAYMWSLIFHALPLDHPLTQTLSQDLADPLPPAFIGVACLDLANSLAATRSIPHPFNSPDGIARLEAYLTSADPRQFTYANSAAAALPFLHNPQRDQLMALAANHPDTGVKMRAGWSRARLGDEFGARYLSEMCLNPRHSQTAWGYLETLKRQELIPIEAQRPDFRAIAEMCNWLSHPMEFGRPPDEIEVYDARELDWPPTNDRRQLWLLKFRYLRSNGAAADTISVGMVGSITFSLSSDREVAHLPPEDIYALHCCWELEKKHDPRAEKARSIDEGRRLLGI